MDHTLLPPQAKLVQAAFVHFDGFFHQGKAAIDVLIWHNDGSILVGLLGSVPTNSAEICEAIAFTHAMRFPMVGPLEDFVNGREAGLPDDVISAILADSSNQFKVLHLLLRKK